MHVEKLKWCRSCAFMFFACLISLANCEWIKSDAGPNKGVRSLIGTAVCCKSLVPCPRFS